MRHQVPSFGWRQWEERPWQAQVEGGDGGRLCVFFWFCSILFCKRFWKGEGNHTGLRQLNRHLHYTAMRIWNRIFIIIPRGPSVLEKRHPNWKDDVSAISTTNQEKVDDLQKSWRFESSTYPHTYPCTIATTARWTSFVFSERRGSKTLVRWKRHRTIKMKLIFWKVDVSWSWGGYRLH